MSYDAGLLERCRDVLRSLHAAPISDKNTFGARGLMLGKRMFAAVGEESILVKLVPAEYDDALARDGVTPFAPGGDTPMTTWVEVDAELVADDPQLREWLEAGLRALRA